MKMRVDVEGEIRRKGLDEDYWDERNVTVSFEEGKVYLRFWNDGETCMIRIPELDWQAIASLIGDIS